MVSSTLPIASPGQRLRGLLLLLLMALGLLAGVSVLQTRQLETQALQAEAELLPALQQLQPLLAAVDDWRGMSALHLALRDEPSLRSLEGRMLAIRGAIERRLAAQGRELKNPVDRQHHQAALARLAAYAELQGRLQALSRQALADPRLAVEARSLLAGPAQQAWQDLRDALQSWWQHQEQAATQAAAATRAAAHVATLSVWAAAALAGLALAAAWAQYARGRVQPRHWAARLAATPPTIDQPAVQRHLQALNAAVAAARRGEPGRAAGLSAVEAERLAEQVAGAAQGLRALIERPSA